MTGADSPLVAIVTNYNQHSYCMKVMVHSFHTVLTEQEHVDEFENLCEAVFLALGSLASSREEIRIKVSSEANCLTLLTQSLRDSPSHVRIAAVRCVCVCVCVWVYTHVCLYMICTRCTLTVCSTV